MALKFRLKGLAETFLEELTCPGCGNRGKDDELFSTEMTRVTFDGIVVIAECKICGELFVPTTQRLGVISQQQLRLAVEKDLEMTGEHALTTLGDVRVNVQRMNAERRGQIT